MIIGWRSTRGARSTRVTTVLAFGAGLAVSGGCGPSAESRVPWTPPLRRVDQALARNDVAAAQRAAHDAYVATRVSARWDGHIALGDAYRRIGEAANSRAAAEATARRTYLDAFLLARQQGSLEGVLQSAAAFAALGDDRVVQQCLGVARSLAARSGGDAPERVTAWTERLAAHRSLAQISGAETF